MVRRRKARVLRRAVMLALGILLLIAAGIYVYFGVYFKSHFFYRTNIEDVAVGGMTAEEAIEELRSQVQDYLLVMLDRNGNKYQILGVDFNYDYQPKGEEEKLIGEQKPFLWPGNITKDKTLDMEQSITYDETLLREAVMSLGCMQADQMTQPVDAYIQVTDAGYELVPEQQGSYLIADKLFARVKAAVDAGETEFTFTDDLYEKPSVTSEDTVLTNCMTQIFFITRSFPVSS